MSLESNKFRCVALFVKPIQSINIGEEICSIHNADSEFRYTSSEISFLSELRINTGRVICYNRKII